MSAHTPASALDRLITDNAREVIEEHPIDGAVAVLDDPTGELTLWAAQHARGRILVRCRNLTHARRVAERLHEHKPDMRERITIAGLHTPHQPAVTHDNHGSLELLLEQSRHANPGGAPPPLQLALARLPKSLAALDDWARSLARAPYISPHFHLIAGANTTHMSRGMNTVLEHSFARVRALRGRGKFRCLDASTPHPVVEAHAPRRSHGLVAFGGVFSSATFDHGGRALAQAARMHLIHHTAQRVLDLGSGNGAVSRALLSDPAVSTRIASLTASDIDLDAVRSTRASLDTLPSIDADIHVHWDDCARTLAPHSMDLIVLNPPFHEGTRVDPTLVAPLIDAAARILVPGGTLLCVHNSHLRYRPLLEAHFPRVTQVQRNRKFTVLSAHTSR